MTQRLSIWTTLLASSVALATTQAACDSNPEVPNGTSSSGSGNTSTSGEGGVGGVPSSTGAFNPSAGGSGAGNGGGGGGTNQTFDVQPEGLQTISVPIGTHSPTVTYQALLDGHPINAGWGVDQGAVGNIPSASASSAIFTPTGTTGGFVNVLAGLNGTTLKRQVLVQLTGSQNGVDPNNPATKSQIATTPASLAGGGGIGGVGGEGLGIPVDGATATLLGTPTGDGTAQNLGFLYPYDKTVWPRGLLAPLLQWNWSVGDADAIQIKLRTTSGSFSWTGTFGRPAVLGLESPVGKFVRHPIPQDIWEMATNSAGGQTANGPDQITVSLTVAQGGKSYGPISETWTVAPGHLAGTVYYNSYGTHLVANSTDNDHNNKQYGAAVLAIKDGDTGPTVVAGNASGYDGSGCRVCHVVASNGSRLVVQTGNNYSTTSTYDLQNANAQTILSNYPNTFGWAGLSPDGNLAMTNAADLAADDAKSQLYAFPPAASGAMPLTATGIPTDLKAGTPSFSPDGKHVSFDFISGTIGSTMGNGKQLVSMDFDGATNTFSNLKVLASMDPNDANARAGFPSFFPTNDAVAFHKQIVASNHRYNTWHQARAQVWWSDTGTGTAANLSALNGLEADGVTSYLPNIGTNHAKDTELNYEPTVNPVASGGYVWVVFTSRREYGSIATGDPWTSDPRNYDATNYALTTTKKLWVAAIDLNAPPGTDPSHPAFYLPAQELLAGNARAFWVLDPCRQDGQGCETGDQCCGGFCEPDSNDNLVCGNSNPNSHCSMTQEKCTTAADCCDSTNSCINGFCALQAPQ